MKGRIVLPFAELYVQWGICAMSTRRNIKDIIGLVKTEGDAVESKKSLQKYGFDKSDPFFRMHTFRASKDLSEKHDEIYEGV